MPPQSSRVSSLARPAILAALLVLPHLAGCDLGCNPIEERSWFDDQDNRAHLRDNYLASGNFFGTIDEVHDIEQSGGVLHLQTDELYGVQMDYLFTYNEADFYSFLMHPEELPIDLVPGEVNDLQLGHYGGDNPIYADAEVQLDPDVIVLPVVTWNFISDEDDLGVDIDERAMKYAFDKAPGTELPQELEVSPGQFENYADNYWANERVDQLFEPCKVQFRHVAHYEVVVPWCKASSVMALDSGLGRCFNVPDDNCADEASVACPQYNLCTVGTYISHMEHHVEGVLNVYFFRSFDPSNHPLDYGVNCMDWVYINDGLREGSAQDQPGRRVAHEIGHALGLYHQAGTLMSWTVDTYTDVLTSQQCTTVRTSNTDLLANALPGFQLPDE